MRRVFHWRVWFSAVVSVASLYPKDSMASEIADVRQSPTVLNITSDNTM
jgi:hypothetical protein